MYLLFCSFALLWTLVSSLEDGPHPLSDEFIDSINREQHYWKAERTFPIGTTMKDIKRLLGFRMSNQTRPLARFEAWHAPRLTGLLPDSFDPRDKWPGCPTLNVIRDQGACGSCWVFGSVAAITDRYCTYSNGTQQFYFSTEDALACLNCGSCEDGGYPDCVYAKWESIGIVSGGDYGSNQGCRPYEIPPCYLHKTGRPCGIHDFVATPKCVRSCVEGYTETYERDVRYASEVYYLDGNDEENIRIELYENGPVSAVMSVHEDFLSYKSGVYKYIKGDYVYGHVVKILGWGEEKGLKYWLGANSWNVEWGERGFFKILRGENECGIESTVITGIPLYPEQSHRNGVPFYR